MSQLKMREGAYAVLRNFQVRGPIKRSHTCTSEECASVCYVYPWDVGGDRYDENGRYIRGERGPRDIIATYQTEAEAHDALTAAVRETFAPRLLRFLYALSPMFVEIDESGIWIGVYWQRVARYAIVAIFAACIVGLALIGCVTAPAPDDHPCTWKVSTPTTENPDSVTVTPCKEPSK
jgi:hypothetical protein